MTCQEAELELSAYLDEALSEPEKREVERHLTACPACQHTLKQLEAVVALTRSLPPRELPANFESELRPRLLAAVPTATLSGRPRRRGAWSTPVWAAAGLAAAVILAVVGTRVLPAANAVKSRAQTQVASSHSLGVPQQGTASSATAPSVGAPQAMASKAAPPPGNVGIAGNDTTPPDSLKAFEPERQIVYDAALTMAVPDVRAAYQRLSESAQQMAGYVENGRLDQADVSVSAHLVVRVPAAQLNVFLSRAKAVGSLRSESSTGQDVTRHAIDMQARLSALQEEESRYKELLARATKVDDMIKIQQQLTQVRAQIEGLLAEQRQLTQATALATVTIDLVQEIPGAASQPAPFASQLGQVLQLSWGTLLFLVSRLLVGLVWVLPYLGVAALVSGLGWTIWRRFGRGAGA